MAVSSIFFLQGQIVFGGAAGFPKVTFYISERTDTNEPLFLGAALHERRDPRRSPCSSLLLSTLFFSLPTTPLRSQLNLFPLNSLIPRRCAPSFAEIALRYPSSAGDRPSPLVPM